MMMEKILFIIVMIIALYLSINVIQNFSIKFDLLTEIIKEFKEGYIEDIILGENGICPMYYENIISQTFWPGSYKGCGCKIEDKSSVSFSFYPNFCPKLRECYSVEETYKKILDLWRGKTICYRRSDVFYTEQNVAKQISKNELICSNSTHKNCGIIDGKSHYLCLERNKTCPINQIKIVNVEQNDKENFTILNDILKNKNTREIINNKIERTDIYIDEKKETTIQFDSGFKVFQNKISGLNETNYFTNKLSYKDILNTFSDKFLIDNPKNDFSNFSKNFSITINKIENGKFTKPTFYPDINNPNNGFYSLYLSEKFNLVFSRNELKESDMNKKQVNIPIFFKVETGIPCLDPLKKPSSEYFFPLMKNKFDYMCDLTENKTEIHDEHLEEIDSYPLTQFYKENKIFDEIDTVTSPFEIGLEKKNIHLFSRNYLGWSSKCLTSSPDSLQNFIKIEENLNNILIMNILHSFISIGGIIALGIFACFLSKYFEILFKFVNLGFCVLNLIFPIQIISNSNWIINLFTDEDGVFCGDNTLNILLIEVSNSCLEMQNSYIWILLITIFYSFFFIYMLYKWIKPFHQEYQEKFKHYINMK